jgi:hypothetical protein
MTVTYSVQLSNGTILTQTTPYAVTIPSFSVAVAQAPPTAVIYDPGLTVLPNGNLATLPEMVYSTNVTGMSTTYGPLSSTVPLTNGNYQWVQIVNQSKITQTDDPADPDPDDTEIVSGLDKQFPTSTNVNFTDSPVEPFGGYNGTIFLGFEEVIRDDSFTLYLEFQPISSNPNNNLFVPIWKVSWSWGGTAAQNSETNYTVVPHQFTPVTQGTSAFGSSNFPIWTSVVKP